MCSLTAYTRSRTVNGKGKGVDRSTHQQQGEDNRDHVHPAPRKDADHTSTLGLIRSKISKVFSRRNDTASTTSRTERPQTPVLDPSTNANPFLDRNEDQDYNYNSKKDHSDSSKHTFYIENGRMKLKINSRDERQMLQWTSALEKAAMMCYFTRRSRFDSFAPVQLNVATQWLVDGVRVFLVLSHIRTHAYDF